jgi:hypothetical protein
VNWNLCSGPVEFTIVPRRPVSDCEEFADVVNSPYHEHKDLFIDISYGHTAEQEVSDSPREFRFVTNCADYQAESDRLLILLGATAATPQKYDEALAKLGTSAKGRGRFWITEWKISHCSTKKDTKRDWAKFRPPECSNRAFRNEGAGSPCHGIIYVARAPCISGFPRRARLVAVLVFPPGCAAPS